MTRMLSCKHSKKVSCKTLSLSNVYFHNNLQFETPSFSCNVDGEKDHMKEDSTAVDEASNELENPNYIYCNLDNDHLQHARELETHIGKLDNPNYGDGKAARDKFLSRFLSSVLHTPAASHAKEVERLRKHLRTHPTAIRRTGGVLPQSAGPIVMHIGSHSGAPNCKASATLRASSIIPRNAVTGKMNTSTGEPLSPKVTCLGRVRNKQKLFGNCTSVASNDTKENQVDVCCTSMLRRRKKKADKDVVESASKKEKKTSRIGSGNAMVGVHLVAQSKKTDCEKALKKLTAQSSGGKCSMSSRFVAKEESKIWSLREITKHEESPMIPNQHQQSSQGIEASAPGALSSEIFADLSPFGSESQRCHEMVVTSSVTSSVGNDSQRFEQYDKEDFVQAPPQNALLLIRNRNADDQSEVASSSVAAASLPNRQETNLPAALDDHVINQATGAQFYRPTSRLYRYEQDLPPLSEAEMKKPVMIADVIGHTSALTTGGASSTACKSEKFQKNCSLQTERSGGHRQASLPKPSPEASIWQRRAIKKPLPLDIKKAYQSRI